MYYSSPILLAKSNMEKLNFSQVSNVVCDGSPSMSVICVRYSKPYFSYSPVWFVDRYTAAAPSLPPGA